MIIKEIHIDGFGIFRDFSIALPGKGIHIFLGENEAGKSTLMKFLKYTLFGYPHPLRERMAPVSVGRHGGRIVGLLSDNSETIFNRDSSDKILMVHKGQETSDPARWNQALGNATSKMFEKIYAFTLDELVGLDSIRESGMEDKIYSIGLGLGNISLSNIQSGFQAKSDQIYKPSGRKENVISNLVDEILKLRASIRETQENLPRYSQLTAAMENLDAKSQELSSELLKLETERKVTDAYLRCYPAYLDWKNAGNALLSLPPLKDFPNDGPHKMEQLTRKRELLLQKKEQLERGTPDMKGIIETEQLRDNLEVNLSLLQQKETIDYIRLNLARYKETLKQRDNDNNRQKEIEQQVSQTIAEKINARWTTQDVVNFGNMAAMQSKVEEFTQSLRNVIDEKRKWEGSETTLLSQKGSVETMKIAALLSLVFVLASFPFFWYGLHIPGGISLVIALVFYMGRKAFKKSDPLDPVREKISEYTQQEQEIILQYRQWLQKELNLSPDLTFQALTGVFQQVENIKSLLHQANGLRLRIQEQWLPFLVEFEGRVKGVVDFLSNEITTNDTPLIAQGAITDFDENTRVFQNIKRLTEDVERLKKEQQFAIDDLENCATEIKELLLKVEAPDEIGFFEKYKVNNQVKSLIETRVSSEKVIEQIAGYNKTREVIAALDETEKQQMESRLSGLELIIKEKKVALATLYEEKGSKSTERERIAGISDLTEQLTMVETARGQLQNAYKNWLARKVALQMLSDVKADYENERQPAVIKTASHYLKSITNGKYLGIRTSIDNRELQLFDERQASLGLHQLSRGTREQLLLCLRLGFIEEYETHAEPLPVIVDEIMVNFDAARARRTANILQEFAANRQVLLFTCHPYTAELFTRKTVFTVNS